MSPGAIGACLTIIPNATLWYGLSRGRNKLETLVKTTIKYAGVPGLLAIPFCGMAMEKCFYDTLVSAQGVNTAFQEAKLELQVRPHVTADGSVSMHVRVTRDEPDFSRTSVRGDPTILKREAETDLLIPDGHTAVIGGIYTRTTSRNVAQVPFFGDIPVLGVLFQNRRIRDDRNELLIFLTPRIVNRASALRE